MKTDRSVAAVLIRRAVVVSKPFASLALPMRRPPAEWLGPLAEATQPDGGTGPARVGFDIGGRVRLRKEVVVRVGPPVLLSSKALFPMTWQATGASWLFPMLEGDLEVSALGPASTEIALRARYCPPIGRAGRTIDRSALHRIAEATIDDFLARTARYLEDPTEEGTGLSGAAPT